MRARTCQLAVKLAVFAIFVLSIPGHFDQVRIRLVLHNEAKMHLHDLLVRLLRTLIDLSDLKRFADRLPCPIDKSVSHTRSMTCQCHHDTIV